VMIRSRPLKAATEVDGHEGVEAEVEEAGVEVERSGVGVTEDGASEVEDEGEEQAEAVGVGERQESREERGVLGVVGERGGEGLKSEASLWDFVEERPRASGGEGGSEASPVDVGEGEEGLTEVEALRESGESERGGHGQDAAALERSVGGVREHAGVSPGAPGDGGSGEAELMAV